MIPRIDFQNEINENFGNPIYWTYSFNVEYADVWHEETGSVIKAKYLENGGHYSAKMSRTDHLTLNHFADVSNKNGGVTLSSLDCLFMKLGDSEPQKLDERSSQVNVLIGGQVDKELNLGIKNQGGDDHFEQHLALIPHKNPFNKTESMKYALEHQNPMVTGMISGGKELPGDQYSFMNISGKDAILWTLKPGEENGIVGRVWNLSGEGMMPVVSFNHIPKNAFLTSNVETEIEPLRLIGKSIELKARQQQLLSFKVIF
jgi:alpha-mannosidase